MCCLDYQTTHEWEKAPHKGRLKGGVEKSEQDAEIDADRLRRNKEMMTYIREAAKQTGIDPAIIAAIISRESNCGTTLCENGWAKKGKGYGVMQVDSNSHTPKTAEGPTSLAHILQGANILRELIKNIKEDVKPSWPPEWQIRGAIAAYNFGPDDVRTMANLDKGSTGHDYSSDVLARAQYFKRIGLFQ